MHFDTSISRPCRLRCRWTHLVLRAVCARIGGAAFGIVAALLATGSPLRAEVSFQTVALSGQQATGAMPGVNYLNFGIPALSASGESSFLATLAGTGVTNGSDAGLWSGAPGGLALIAREGDHAPGTSNGITFSDFPSNPAISDAGATGFRAELDGTGAAPGNRSGIWMGAADDIMLVAREGEQAAGMDPGVTYANFAIDTPALNARGQTAFLASVTGPGITASNDRALWFGAPGALALLAREGGPAPGMSANVNYSLFNSNVTLNAAGQSAFTATVSGPAVTSANDGAIWVAGASGATLLAREGSQAPGAPADVVFASFDAPVALNGAGQATFLAELAGASVSTFFTTANYKGLWTGTPGNLAKLARLGDPAPGTETGTNYFNFGTDIIVNDSGRSAFTAETRNFSMIVSGFSGIGTGFPGAVSKLVRDGEAAPGAGAGVRFSNFLYSPLAMNNRNEVVFFNTLFGSGVTNANDGSLWFADPAGALSLIVREGSLLEVTPGDLRTIASLRFDGGSTNPDSFRSGFNDLGQITFGASFTDGSSGIFLVTVPEPGPAVLVIFGGGAAAAFRRRPGC